MSEAALSRPQARAARSPARPLARAAGLLEREGLVVVVLSLCLLLLVVEMSRLLVPDSWLALVDGRLIAAHGLPHHDTLTHWTLGRPWVDQQWGAQLVLYELARLGGLRAALAAGIGSVVAALVVLAVAARKLGASSHWVALALLVPLCTAPWLATLRTQSFGLIGFAVVYALLALDARRPGRKVLWVLPVLAVWANLHGSVALGSGLAFVYGVTLARRRAHRARGLVLALGSPLCLLVSPYGFGLLSYYRLMLFHPPFASFVTEWAPPAVGPSTALFFASAFAVSALWGRYRPSLTSFERWALPVLLLLAVTAVRNVDWFELAAALALPRALDAARPSRLKLPPPVRRINLLLAAAAVAAAAAVCASAFARTLPPSSPNLGASPAAAAAIARAAGPHGTVLADDMHADWLLWLEPSLSRRVDYDSRFELLTRGQLVRIRRLQDGLQSSCSTDARVVMYTAARYAATAGTALRRQLDTPGSRPIVRAPGLIAFAKDGRCPT